MKGHMDTELAALFAQSPAAELPLPRLIDASAARAMRQTQIASGKATNNKRKPQRGAREVTSDDDDDDVEKDTDKMDEEEDVEEEDEEEAAADLEELLGVEEEEEEDEEDEDEEDDAIEAQYETRRAGQSTTATPGEDESDANVDEHDIGDDDGDKEMSTSASLPKEMQTAEERARTLFVGNLPVSFLSRTGKRELVQRFSQYGKIESMRFRSVPIGTLKIPRKVAARKSILSDKLDTCNAYFKYTTREGMTSALAENGQVLDGKHLRVDASDHANDSLDHRRAIFIGNLPFVATDEHLWDTFSSCGEIDHVRIVRDAETQLGKGFAFVTFKDHITVDLALKINGIKVEGRALRVTRAKNPKKAQQKKLHQLNQATKQDHQQQHRRHLPGQRGGNKTFEGTHARKGVMPNLKRIRKHAKNPASAGKINRKGPKKPKKGSV